MQEHGLVKILQLNRQDSFVVFFFFLKASQILTMIKSFSPKNIGPSFCKSRSHFIDGGSDSRQGKF